MKHFYLILVSTFIIGFITGIYVFFATRTPAEIIPPGLETQGVEIIADEYGGCILTGSCGSYRINDDGEYTYLVRSREGAERQYSDVLSASRARELFLLVAETDLQKVEASSFSGTCPASVDGVSYRFELMVEGERYHIDSCEHSILRIALFDELIDYFEIFRVTHE